MEREDVRVLEVGGGADFLEEPIGSDHSGKVGPQHLERDLTVVAEILRQVHRRHAPGAELALDSIAVMKSVAKLRDEITVHSSPFTVHRFGRTRARAIAAPGAPAPL